MRLHQTDRSGTNVQPEANRFANHLPIEKAYVPLRAGSAAFGREADPRFLSSDSIGPEGEDISKPYFTQVFELLNQFGETGIRGALVFGVAGSGKTTGAQKLAWLLAKPDTDPTSLGLPSGTVPLLLKFREMNFDDVQRADENDPDDAAREPLERFLVRKAKFKPEEGPTILAGPALLSHSEPLLWILDGLDELPNEEVRYEVCNWIVRLCDQIRPNDYFLVTLAQFRR